MIYKKNAFTLIEVLMAMSILTFIVFTISNIQIRQLNRVLFERDRLEHTLLLKSDCLTNLVKAPEDGKKIINKIEYPQTSERDVKMISNTQDINAKSSLTDLKKYIKLLFTQATWKTNNEQHELSMASIVFKPEKKEKDNK